MHCGRLGHPTASSSGPRLVHRCRTRLLPMLPDPALSIDDRRPNMGRGCRGRGHDDYPSDRNDESRAPSGSVGRAALAAASPQRHSDAQRTTHLRAVLVGELAGLPATICSRGSHCGCSGRPRGLPGGRRLRSAPRGCTTPAAPWSGHLLVDEAGAGSGPSVAYPTSNTHRPQPRRRRIYAVSSSTGQSHHPCRRAATAGRGRVAGGCAARPWNLSASQTHCGVDCRRSRRPAVVAGTRVRRHPKTPPLAHPGPPTSNASPGRPDVPRQPVGGIRRQRRDPRHPPPADLAMGRRSRTAERDNHLGPTADLFLVVRHSTPS
jgi:hypothetical protein